MKKIIYSLVALLVLAACNNKTATENQETGIDNATAQCEMPAANDEGQDGWAKQTTLMGSKPMVIDFFATWCGPCKELSPILEEVEQNHKGDVIFKRIDVDKEAELAMEFHIEAVPTLMFVTPNGEYQTLLGLQDAATIESKIAELLTRSSK